jgi:uncharacterized protein YndB with AHSA1/START domain
MRCLFPVLAASVALIAGAAGAATPDVTDSSFVAPDGSKTLQESVVIAAPVDVLWKAFVDAKEFVRWNAPVAAIDLRVGGSLEAAYDPSKAIGDPDNIRHRIVTYLPNQLIVFQNIQAPHMLPHADIIQKTVTIVQYQPLSATSTRVTLSSTGWGSDPVSAQLYAFFQGGNAEQLEKMKQVYEAH